MRVLAIDPSLRGTGYAIVETVPSQAGVADRRATTGNPLKARVREYGTIKNKSDLLASSCLVAIHDRLAELIHAHEPDCCAVEGVIFVQSYKTAITLGAARGAAILAAAERGLPIHEYAPRAVKMAVVGRGAADKNQVAFMVRALLGLTETPAADAADALAIGLTHLRAQGSALRAVKDLVRI
jgi:crossover junction endodeoxyribonuclease RuvC